MGILRRFVTGSDKPSTYVVKGRVVRCPHCGGIEHRAQVTRLGLTSRSFFMTSECALVCVGCGKIEFFLEAKPYEPGTCPACQYTLGHSGAKTCPECGEPVPKAE